MVYIVFGRKPVRRVEGYAADFCPICRNVKPFKIIGNGLVNHIYHVPIGRVEVVGHERACTECGIELDCDPDRYDDLARWPDRDVVALARTTHRGVGRRYRDRLELERQVRRDPDVLDPAVRTDLIREPFDLLADRVAWRLAKKPDIRKNEWWDHLAMTVLFAVWGLIFLASAPLGRRFGLVAQASWVGAFGAISIFSVVFAFCYAPLSKRLWIKFKVIPKLVLALSPLRATREELLECIAGLRGRGQKIGRVVRISDLTAVWDGLERGARAVD